DGDRDPNHDGLPVKWELFFGYNPTNTALIYSNQLGVLVSAADYDPDGDSLSNLEEYRRGTNPFNADSDGDGWDDAGEAADGSNPMDRGSRPRILVTESRDVTYLNAVSEAPPSNERWLAASSDVAYLNALSETLPTDAQAFAVSLPANYLNLFSDTP